MLTLTMLNLDISCFENIVNPDQLVSEKPLIGNAVESCKFILAVLFRIISSWTYREVKIKI